MMRLLERDLIEKGDRRGCCEEIQQIEDLDTVKLQTEIELGE